VSLQPATMPLDALAPGLRERVLAQRWALVVGGAMLAWSLALMAIVRNEYVDFRLPRYDLGNMVQAVWSTAHGNPLEVTGFTGEQLVRLGIHTDAILALFAPLWLVAPTPLTLLFVRIGALALGALPIFWLARRHLGSEKVAGLLALAYLAYPWLGWSARDAFHPVTLAIPLFLFCVWFLETDRHWQFAVCASLAALTGELVGVTIAALGIWFALARGRRRAGAVIALLGVTWTFVAVYVIVPTFADGPSAYYGYFGSLGGSPQSVVRTAFADPGAVAAELVTARDISYVLLLSLPLACLFLLSPGLAAVALPQVLTSALSDAQGMTDPRHHYAATAVPFLLAATVLAVARVQDSRRFLAATTVLSLSVAFSLLVGAWPGVPGNVRSWDTVAVTHDHADALRDAVALVPADAAVSATNKAGSHLSGRRYFYSPLFVGRADWIVLDTMDPFIADPGFPVLEKDPVRLQRFRRRIEASPRWSKVFERDGVLVFRKKLDE
jgi:uncharacterized membrane protein